jgi:hypothetical protein
MMISKTKKCIVKTLIWYTWSLISVVAGGRMLRSESREIVQWYRLLYPNEVFLVYPSTVQDQA